MGGDKEGDSGSKEGYKQNEDLRLRATFLAALRQGAVLPYDGPKQPSQYLQLHTQLELPPVYVCSLYESQGHISNDRAL